MKNPDLPAFPYVVQDISKFQAQDAGLTKREYAAIKAMQGILAAEPADACWPDRSVAKRAMACADALLAELSATPAQQGGAA